MVFVLLLLVSVCHFQVGVMVFVLLSLSLTG